MSAWVTPTSPTMARLVSSHRVRPCASVALLATMLWAPLALAATALVVEPVEGAARASGPAVLTQENAGVGVVLAVFGGRDVEAGGLLELAVLVDNEGAAPVAFGPERLRVQAGDDALAVVDADELQQQIRATAKRQRKALSDERKQRYAALPPVYFSGALTTVGQASAPLSLANGSDGSVADIGRAEGAPRSGKPSLRELRRRLDAWEQQSLQAVSSTALTTGDIGPGADRYGHVMLRLPQRVDAALPLVVAARVGEQVFRFELRLRPASAVAAR